MLEDEQRPASSAEQQVLAAWSGWGASGLAEVFDERTSTNAARREVLRELLSDAEYRAAQKTTLNAHYTDPQIATALWGAVRALGFEQGRVLEPGCGAGVFMGLAPAGCQVTGVELDPITAGIAAALYPDATVRAESFADTKLAPASFDLAIGNVPFGDIVLHDPTHNPGKLSMHNHFIVKSLNLVRPGGLVAVLTSRWTMDGTNPAARRAIMDRADLVGAVRLPLGAHERTAGTNAVTDMLILRRREPDAPAAHTVWDTTVTLQLQGPGEDQALAVNNYWSEYPRHVIGVHRWRSSGYGPTVSVEHEHPSEIGAELAAGLDSVVRFAQDRTAVGQRMVFSLAAPDTVPAVERAAAAEGMLEGALVANPDGSFAVVEDATLTPLGVPATQAVEMRTLLGLRDQISALVRAESTSLDDVALDADRSRLAADWQAYVARYGPINRFTTRRTGRTGEDGEEVLAQVVPATVRRLLSDPHGALTAAIEVFDPVAQAAEPAGMLRRRQVVPREPVRGVDSAVDGLAVVLDQKGWVDLEAVADLMGAGISVDEVAAALGDAIFQVPPTTAGYDPQRPWVTRAEYLSGNVRRALTDARTAALVDPDAWQGNVEALVAVMPPDIQAGEIHASLGAVWIPPSDHQKFLREILDSGYCTVKRVSGSAWEVEHANYGVLATRQWGTERMPAGTLMRKIMEQAPIEVHDLIDVGDKEKRILNRVDTDAAIEKAEQMSARFAEWVWEDGDRSARLVEVYNQMFNSVVLRDYSHEGAALTLPGLATSFVPRDHQRAAVARMLHEPCVGLFHEVGAGKTAEMVMGMTELKRLGLIRKPAVVVPNSMLEQFSREWLQLYPQAAILAAGVDDLSAPNRKRFVARAATNEWDAIVMTRTAFERLALTPRNQYAFLQRELEGQREALARVAGDGVRSRSVKALEKALSRREEQLKAEMDKPADPGVSFEESGIDYLVVDELHDYKNLATPSRIQGAALAGSKRALDLFAKIEYLRQTTGERVFTGATATPIANSITEMYVMMRYHDPAGMRELGMVDFDTWAATFGTVVTQPEVRIHGDGFKMKNRLARFNNVPELLALFNRFADVKTAEDLDLPRPAIAPRPDDGERAAHLLVVQRTEPQAEFMATIAERATQIESGQVDPKEDNMLKLSSEARLGSLDLRLIDPRHPAGDDAGGKVLAAADYLARVYHDTRHNSYLDKSTGEPSPNRGALQLVFCDLGTPGTPGSEAASWDVYTALRTALTDRGVPTGRVRFIHEAVRDRDKAALFSACRNGHVSILIGSTAKMGTGVNIQDRVVHLLHMNAPWRPADLTQRNGRGWRQGNQNPELMLTQVITEQTFDTYSWQTLERKAAFIGQIMRGGADRETGDIADDAFSFAEAKAIGSGNPKLIQLAEVQADLGRLTRLETAHQRTERGLQATIANGARDLAAMSAEADRLRTAAAATQTTDAFAIGIYLRPVGRGVGTETELVMCTDRARAVNLLNRALPRHYQLHEPRLVARIAGHDVVAEVGPGRSYGDRDITYRLADAATIATTVAWPRAEDHPGGADVGTLTRLENLPGRIVRRLEDIALRGAELDRNVTNARTLHGRPFKHGDALEAARERYRVLSAELADDTSQPTWEQVPSDALPTPSAERGLSGRQAPAPSTNPTW
ncbi:helicase-related protein [Propioniciclava soli]|uniref:helicase-related protein n=1 Tax=Propioniciclava soli TaxID=2775081 RepID=UPI001E38FC08